MRPEYAPADAVLHLLARADALAAAATAAIATGDDAALTAVLDDRDVVVAAAVAAARDVTSVAPELRTALLNAIRDSLTLGQAARNTAALAREHVLTELSALDARQHASHEYQAGAVQATIDVVL
jgi:hypothetical protein